MPNKVKFNFLPSTIFFFMCLCFLSTKGIAEIIENSQSLTSEQLESLKAKRDLLLLQLKLINQQIDALTQQSKVDNFVTPTMTSTTNANLKWQKIEYGELPVNAVIVSDLWGKTFVICHMPYLTPAQPYNPSKNGIHPGLWTNSGCMITYGGKVITSEKNAEILTGQSASLTWVTPDKINSNILNSDGRIPSSSKPFGEANTVAMISSNKYSPVYGGEENGHPIFICRTLIGNKAYIGKLSAGYCNVAINNSESATTYYQVLVTY